MILYKQREDCLLYWAVVSEHAGYQMFCIYKIVAIWCCSLPLMSWFFQVVRVTTCREQGNSCYGGQLEGRGGLRTVCRQQYMDHKLVALDQEKGEVVVETFSFPSCCSCFAAVDMPWQWPRPTPVAPSSPHSPLAMPSQSTYSQPLVFIIILSMAVRLFLSQYFQWIPCFEASQPYVQSFTQSLLYRAKNSIVWI